MTALGVTIPFEASLSEHGPLFAQLAQAGYDSLWTAETAGADAFAPLMLASATTTARLGTSVASVYARSPALLAMSGAALAEAAPGRAVLGLGASSAAMVEGWHDREFSRPLQRVVDTARFLRAAFSGERVDRELPTFQVRGFRLERPPTVAPTLLIAALQRRMLAAAGAEADGVILNWLGPNDVPTVVQHVHEAREEGAPAAEVVARIFVCPTGDRAAAHRAAKKFLARYLTVPVYEQYHRWLGRSSALDETWTRWAARDRDGAIAAIPDAVVDDLVGIGTPAECADFLAAYVSAGVTTPVVKVLPLSDGVDPAAAALDVARAFANRAGAP